MMYEQRQSQTQSQYLRRPRKRVQFSCTESVVSSCSSPLQRIHSQDEWDSIWYTGSELQYMRHEARFLCDMIKNNSNNKMDDNNNSSSLAIVVTTNKENDCVIALDVSLSDISSAALTDILLLSTTRGLEKRVCKERQRRRYIASKCILRAASRMSFSDDDSNDIITTTKHNQLAAIAQRCNAYATSLAITEGSRDFFDAYYDELQQMVAGLSSSPSPIKESAMIYDTYTSSSNKRKYDTQQEQSQCCYSYGRNVRPRQ